MLLNLNNYNKFANKALCIIKFFTIHKIKNTNINVIQSANKKFKYYIT